MVIVGIATYMITFNINTMSRLWIRFYNQQRDRIVGQMKRDAEDKSAPKQDVLFWDSETTKTGSEIHLKQISKWNSLAARFEDKFHIVREKSEPSNWILIAYLVRHTGLVISRPVRIFFDSIRMIISRHYRLWKDLLIPTKSSDGKKDGSTAEKGLVSPSGEPHKQITMNGGLSSDTGDAVPKAEDAEIDYDRLLEEDEGIALALRLSALAEDSLQEARARGGTRQQSAELGSVHEDSGSPVFSQTRPSVPP
jgi:hypothetical protein